jgi:ABC-2 type transport system ATP-binding protein
LLAHSEGASILISSHDLAEIESFASHIGYLEGGRLQFSEEMASLTERFREVEVTVEQEPPVAIAEWPASWLNTEQSGVMVRFVETHFDPERTMGEVRQLFQNAKRVAVRAMPLRSIFVTMAKASRRVA